MRLAIGVLIVVQSFVRVASAIVPSVEREIHEQIRTANKMDKEVLGALYVLNTTPAKKDSPEYRELERNVQRAMDRQNAARTVAIHMTIRAYKLAPEDLKGTSVMPWTNGRTIRWMPIAREREAREMQDSKGNRKNVSQPNEELDAAAYYDGVTYIYPSAFSRGPGYLASILRHELTHFEQYTTPGKGDVMSYAEAQAEAYKVQAGYNLNFFDPSKRQELRLMQDIERLRDDEQAKADLEKAAKKTLKGRIRALLPKTDPSGFLESKIHTNAELADISKLVAEAKSHAEIARLEKEKRERDIREGIVFRPPIPTYPPLPPAEPAVIRARGASPFAKSYPRLREFAVDSCKRPGRAESPDLGRGTMTDREYFSDPEGDERYFRIELQSLEGCAKELFIELEFKVRNGTFWEVSSRGWIEDWVKRRYPTADPPRREGDRDNGGSRPTDPDHDRVWDRINPIIGR